MVVMEAFADVMKAFIDVTSTEVFMEASVESSINDVDDMKASTEVLFSAEPFFGAFVYFRESFHGRYERYESFCGRLYIVGASTNASTETPIETSMEAFVDAFMEVVESAADVMEAFTELTSTEAFLKTSVEAFMEAMKI